MEKEKQVIIIPTSVNISRVYFSKLKHTIPNIISMTILPFSVQGKVLENDWISGSSQSHSNYTEACPPQNKHDTYTIPVYLYRGWIVFVVHTDKL